MIVIEPVKNDVRMSEMYKGGDNFGPLWTKQIAIIEKLEEVIAVLNRHLYSPKERYSPPKRGRPRKKK